MVKRLQDTGLKANKEKCEFFRDRVQFCGHEIDREGLRKTQEKIEAVVSGPGPENVSQLRSFVGLVDYLTTASCLMRPQFSTHFTSCLSETASGSGLKSANKPSPRLRA